MRYLAVLILLVMVASIGAGQASIVTLSGTRLGPIVSVTGPGIPVQPVSGGLIRVGTLTGAPSGPSVQEIESVFQEFATGFTSPEGRIGQTFHNPSASDFNDDQIYIWVFATSDGSTPAGGYGHGLFTVSDPHNPIVGAPWIFPIHTGSGADAITRSLNALLDGGADTSFNPIPEIDSTGGGQLILQVPEPTSALLGLTGLLLVFRRRR